MLQAIGLTNFKCFKKQLFPLTSLTVLTGLNGMGKSSLLQSLLLLRQSGNDPISLKSLKLNGPYVSLGSAHDILCEDADDDLFTISIKENDTEDVYCFDCSPEFSDELPRKGSSQKNTNGSIVFSDHFIYLSAYRIGPQTLYGITNKQDLEKRDLGTNGEFALQYLKQHSNDPVSCRKMVRGEAEKAFLALQVEAWMDLISPGVHPIINIDHEARTAVLGYEFIQDGNKTMTYKSTNVGFGITYVLPVIIALLSAQSGDLLLIENPEAHIHPQGQRYLGELIARAAAAKVQILLETHSDHILNGIRIAAKEDLIDADDVALSYFTVEKGKKDPPSRTILWPKLFSNGQIDRWPEGFFDEWDNSLLALL